MTFFKKHVPIKHFHSIALLNDFYAINQGYMTISISQI